MQSMHRLVTAAVVQSLGAGGLRLLRFAVDPPRHLQGTLGLKGKGCASACMRLELTRMASLCQQYKSPATCSVEP